jgi:hypothetical protein
MYFDANFNPIDEDGNLIDGLGAMGGGYLNGIATANPNYVPTAADSIGDIDPNGYFTDHLQPGQPGYSDYTNPLFAGVANVATPDVGGPATYTADPGSVPTGSVNPEVITADDLNRLYATNPYSVIADDLLKNQKALAGDFRDGAVRDAYAYQEQELKRIADLQAQRRSAITAQVASELQSVGQWETTSLAELNAEVDRRIANEDAAKQLRETGLEGWLGAYRTELDAGLRKDQDRFASLLGATGLVGKAGRMTFDARNAAERTIGLERADRQGGILEKYLAGTEDARRFGYGGKGDIRNQATNKREGISRFAYGENSALDSDIYNQRKGAYTGAQSKINTAQTNYQNGLQGYLSDYYQQRSKGVADQDDKINRQEDRYYSTLGAITGAGNTYANNASNAASDRGDISAASRIAQANAWGAGAEGVAKAIGDYWSRRPRTGTGAGSGYSSGYGGEYYADRNA